MAKDTTLHIIAQSSAERATQARICFDLGYHAEIYNNPAELEAHVPTSGVIILEDCDGPGSLVEIVAALERAGHWLPIIATGSTPAPRRVVEAIKEGALDYIELPLTKERLASSLEVIEQEAGPYCDARRRVIDARKRLENLTPRELEVLDWLTQGSSNKVIARELEISPRTVEIHRANMMSKLGASHSAEAVRLCLEANMAVGMATPLGSNRGTQQPLFNVGNASREPAPALTEPHPLFA
ncbi:MAG: LuxR C-terminal-related transcriptional regulator [Sphingomonadaceae bacterium]